MSKIWNNVYYFTFHIRQIIWIYCSKIEHELILIQIIIVCVLDFYFKLERNKIMNFDDDDDSEFTFGGGNQSSKLESLFKTNAVESTTNDSLKYKPPKQPQASQSQAQPQVSTTQSSTNSQQILFFSGVQAFK